ncbi:XRE family transcriptional regulator [Tabrizicola sp. WMC-M-20]|nr:XRE family transcriptional regulator [Tabrizicola sp. WMC-M-20]
MQKTITRGQLKAGRDLLGMTQQQLCEVAELPLITLRRLEGRPDHNGLVSQATLDRLRQTMEGLGLQFLQYGDQAHGEGVAISPDRK